MSFRPCRRNCLDETCQYPVQRYRRHPQATT